MRYHLVGLLGSVLVLAAACGGNSASNGGQAAGSGEGAQARAALEQLFALAQAEKHEEAAAYVVYRGQADKERRWKDTSNYAKIAEKAQVDGICMRLRMAMKSGEPTFEKFRTEKESEGEWLIWTVAFGSGEYAMRMHISCLEVNGRIAVGDID